MTILAIETSCDETALAIVKKEGENYSVLADAMLSQIKIHEEWGGVVPNLAKREHAKNLLPLLKKVLEESSLPAEKCDTSRKEKDIKELLIREGNLADDLIKFVKEIGIPSIDAIAVTYGPGLEPTLWVGLNFAKALSILWNKKLIPINHMEGHILSVLLEHEEGNYKTRIIDYPAVALLISGGHTELVHIKEPMSYEVIGRTRDDAVGEAFDKVARILKLPYPGGPEISKLAKEATKDNDFKLPSPMINSDDFDFSFSGLKTSVLYKAKSLGDMTNEMKADMANQFEQAVTKVLLKKSLDAVEKFDAKTFIIGGGVSANDTIRSAFKDSMKDINLLLPDKTLSTDNAIMIGITAHERLKGEYKEENPLEAEARGNLALK